MKYKTPNIKSSVNENRLKKFFSMKIQKLAISIYNITPHTSLMIQTQSYNLKDMFKTNNDFAWEILEEEIKLQTNGINIDGDDIARLLALYMKGVETLNSNRDSREIFFRNRLNNLMMRPNVVQVLNKNTKNNDKQNISVVSESPEHKLKKAELEMRITYAQQEIGVDLKKVFIQHQSKSNLIVNTIQSVVEQKRNKLEERIKMRKLKATTARQLSVQTTEQKVFKPEAITLQTLGQIKQQSQCTVNKKRQRSQSLILKKQQQTQIDLSNKRLSLLVVSNSRKWSQEI